MNSQCYLTQCDDDWEHSYGVKIDTLANLGWTLKIDLTDTALDGQAFERVMHGEPSGDFEEWRRTGSWWWRPCKVAHSRPLAAHPPRSTQPLVSGPAKE